MSTALESDQSEMPAHAGPKADMRYVGLATRVIASVLDAALINLVAIFVALGAALILSLLHLPADLRAVVAAIGGAADILWTLGYFVAFWSTTGQTPGNRVMQIRVVSADGRPLTLRRGPGQVYWTRPGCAPAVAGYVRILFDAKRRGFHDRLARTVVVEAPPLSIADNRRA